MFWTIFEFLFFQLLVGQSQTLKHQNGLEFDFQSIFKHHWYICRKKAITSGSGATYRTEPGNLRRITKGDEQVNKIQSEVKLLKVGPPPLPYFLTLTKLILENIYLFAPSNKLDGVALPDTTSAILKVPLFSKIAIAFEPLRQFWVPSGHREVFTHRK